MLEIVLVHQGEAVPEDQLAELLWGEKQPQDPVRTLEGFVSVLLSELSRYSVTLIPGAGFLELPGADHWHGSVSPTLCSKRWSTTSTKSPRVADRPGFSEGVPTRLLTSTTTSHTVPGPGS
ncbi:MAG: hypothetical protein ACRDVZ_07955 [Jiangellaceae bacterium]